MTIAERWLQQGCEQGFGQGVEEGQQQKIREEDIVIGGILFAQKMMKLTIYTRTELNRKNLDELNAILVKMEAKINADRDIQELRQQRSISAEVSGRIEASVG